MDALDWKIIGEMNANCRTPLSKLAKKLRVGRNVVAYRLNNLNKKGIIKSHICSIDPGKLGYKTYKIYFKTRNKPSEKLFESALSGDKQVISFVKTEGSFDYSCVIAMKNVAELDRFLTRLKSEFRDAVRDSVVSIVVYSHIGKRPKLFFNTESEPLDFILYTGENELVSIDDVDKKLLQSLSQNANMPLIELSKKSGLSLDVAKYRLKKLSKDIITAFRIELNLSKIGLFHYTVLLQTRQITAMDEKKLLTWCSFSKSILYSTKTIGPFDFEINIAIKDINDLNTFLSEMKAEFGELIESYEVLLNSKSIKLNYVPF